MKFLIIESESAEERSARRAVLNASSGESFAATLADMKPCDIALVRPAENDTSIAAGDLAGFDAIFLSGSPIHVYDGSVEACRLVEYMRLVFSSGTPSFGSCAGLHIAVAAAGGSVQPMTGPIEAGIARRITPTVEGSVHRLLEGRPRVWDAPSIHGDEVVSLPPRSRLLATNAMTEVQALEIVHEGGVFWGVQYHPELSPVEIAGALRRQASDLVEAGIADSEEQIGLRAAHLDELGRHPDQTSSLWLLGVDAEFARPDNRRREIANFISAIPDLTVP